MEFLIRVLLSALGMVLIKGGVAMAGHWIAWWAAGLIAAVIVFGGFLILSDSDDWFH